jgi:CheY-like chemotaxis protein
MKKLNVLLIDDDDELFLFLTEKTLPKAPSLAGIKSCTSVTEAIDYLELCNKGTCPFPGIIFVDMNMPEMTGMDFAA